MRGALLLCITSIAMAHIAMWDFSTFDSDRDNINSNRNADPLQDGQSLSDWWFHQNIDYPPAAGNVFQLPANGAADAALASNKAFTPPQYGGYRGFPMTDPRAAPDPWQNSNWTEVTNTHAPNRSDVAGCAWGISYKSDPHQVKPEDFVIFSVVHDCPSRPLQRFQIPNLPACQGTCICSWFWIHKSIGGSDQMYMTPFVCNVTGASPTASPVDVAKAQPPRKCANPADCFFGPRNPMYWKNIPFNMPEPGHYAPTYSILYGFPEGAQKDIFVATNPNRLKTAAPFPTEQICNNSVVNPRNWGSRLVSGQTIQNDGGLVSPNCMWKIYLQGGDGNLIIQSTSLNPVNTIPWTAGNGGNGPYVLSLSSNGNFTVVSSDGVSTEGLLATLVPGSGVGPYRLDLSNNGYLIMRDSIGADRWETWQSSESLYSPLASDPAIWSFLSSNSPTRSNALLLAPTILTLLFLLV